MENLGRNQFLEGTSHTMPSLTNASTSILRQQMDESNHDMVQMLAQSLSIVLNSLIKNTTQSNQQMAAQMTRMAEFFGVPQPIRQPQRELIRGNHGVVLEEDMTTNQNPPPDGITHRVEI